MKNESLKREKRSAAQFIREVHCSEWGGIKRLESAAGLQEGHLSNILSKASRNYPGRDSAELLQQRVRLPLAALVKFHTPIGEVIKAEAKYYQ